MPLLKFYNMPILKTWQLKQFKQFSSQIQDTEVNPLLSYLKLTKEGYLIKNNLQIVCMMKVDFEKAQTDMFQSISNTVQNQDILLHERTLFGLVNSTKSESLSIDTIDKKVIISDNKTKVIHQLEDVALYPEIPEIPNEINLIFDKGILQTIKVAKAFISSDPAHTNHQAVHMIDNLIGGIDSHAFYIKEYEHVFPNIMLTIKIVDVLIQFDTIKYLSSTKSHYFFKSDNPDITYIFTKSEWSSPNFLDLLDKTKAILSNEVKAFSIKKEDLVEFCDVVNSISENKVTVCKLGSDENNNADIKLIDSQYNKEIQRKIGIQGEISEFSFNSKLIFQNIKALPSLVFNCSITPNALFILSPDNSYVCFMGVYS